MEDINCILNTGEVANLFAMDEHMALMEDLKEAKVDRAVFELCSAIRKLARHHIRPKLGAPKEYTSSDAKAHARREVSVAMIQSGALDDLATLVDIPATVAECRRTGTPPLLAVHVLEPLLVRRVSVRRARRAMTVPPPPAPMSGSA